MPATAPPRFAVRPNPLARGLLTPLVRHTLPAGCPHVRLTFDDGPYPPFTLRVLDRLRAADVPATFFVLGKLVDQHPEAVTRIAADGHDLGNHGHEHRRYPTFSLDAPLADVAKGQTAITAVTGRSPTLLRPPFGRVTPGVWRAARRLKLALMNWSLDSGDWRCQSEDDADRCADAVAVAARPRDVILLHDNHRWIDRILERLVPRLDARGLLEHRA